MEREPEKELVELAWQELAIQLELTGEHCGWFKSWLTKMLVSYARGMYDASQAVQSEREKAMADALTLVLRFHRGGPWSQEDIGEWLRVTGKTDATTKVMCDTIRAALATPPGA